MYPKSIRIRCIYCRACFIRNDQPSGTSVHNNPTKITIFFSNFQPLQLPKIPFWLGNIFHAVRSHKPNRQTKTLASQILSKRTKASRKLGVKGGGPPILLIGDTSIQSRSMFDCHVTLPEGFPKTEGKKWQFFFRKRNQKNKLWSTDSRVLHHDGREFLPERFHSWFFTSEIHKPFHEVLNNS